MKTTNVLKAIGISFCLFICTSSSFAISGLLNQWSGEGDANDSVGIANGSFATLDGSADPHVTFTTGHDGLGFAFDGNGYIDFTTNVTARGTHDFAVAFWIQTTSAAEQAVLGKMDGYYWGRGFQVYVTNGFIRCVLRGDNGLAPGVTNSVDVISLARVNDGGFHHVVCERYNMDLYVFIDGVIQGKGSSTQILNLPEAPYTVTNEIPIVNGLGEQVMNWDGTPVVYDEVDVVTDPVTCLAGAGQNPQAVISLTCDGTTIIGFDAYVTQSIGKPFTGTLDEVQIYGRALTAYEVYSVSHPGVELAFIDQPLNQRGLSGRPIILHSLAVGIDPLTYQWRVNGADIPGATSNNLYFNVPRTFDSGAYSVVIGNPSGTLTSRDATLTITNLATPTNGLLARWSGEGTANDLTGRHNGLTSNIKYVKGVLGTCFQFDGNSSTVRSGNVLGNIGTADFTVDYWMKTTTTPMNQMAILGQRPYCSWTDCMDFRLFHNGGGALIMEAELGDTRDWLNPPFNHATAESSLSSVHLNDGMFHHIGFVRQGATVSMYIDGQFVHSCTSVEPCLLNNSGSFDMGFNVCQANDGTVPFVGCLDEVEVFARALSAQELYNTYSPDPSLSILQQPVSTYVVEGTPTVMTCCAAGTDPITYQWRLNGINIPGATSSTYSLVAAQLADDGIYSVAVQNPVTNKLSAAAKLTVIPANSILPGLVNRWSAEGDYVDSMGNAQMYGGQTSFAPGVSGQAWKFDGHYDMVSADYHSGQPGYNDFTWATWIKCEIDGTLIASIPAYRFAVQNGQILAQCGNGFRNMLDWGVMSEPDTFNLTAPFNVHDGNWHHIAWVRRNTTTLEIYIDGSLAAQAEMPVFDMEDQWGLGIVDDYRRTQPFAGEMDETEYYNRALEPFEIAQLYGKYANGPRADYKMQDISVQLGKSFTLYAGLVSGGLTGPLTYQWTLNGVPIAGATSNTYTVSVNDDSAAGIYAVTITSGTGSISSPLARVSVQLSAGMYNGLFYFDGDTSDDDDGFITLTLDINSTFSGSVMQKAKKYSFTGRMSGTSTTIPVARKGLSPLYVTLTKANSTKITGYVASGGRSMPMQAHRAVYDATHTSSKAGSYTVQMVGLSSPTAPNGHGIGNATVSPNGAVTFLANLADDTVVSQSAMVGNSGMWPVYIPAYAGKGSVIGWLSFTNNGGSVCSGNLKWTKKAAPLSRNYKAGFATRVPVVASTFKAPTVGLGIGVTNSSVVLDAAQLYSPLNAPVVSSNLNTIVFAQPGSKGTVKVTPSTGRFKGTFINPVTKAASPLKGVVLQDQGFAAGYFMSPSLSGRAVLQHN